MDYFQFGPFRLEPSTRSLFREDEFVTITPKAFDTLCVLVEEAGRLVSKEDLMQRVWPDAFVEDGSIANNISMLRKILNPHFEGEGPIATVSRRGYRFTAPVTLKSRQSKISVVSDSGNYADAARQAVASVDTQDASSVAVVRVAPVMPSNVPAASAVNRTARVIVAAVLVAALTGAALTFRTPAGDSSEVPTVRRAVAVLSMKDLSGNDESAWFSTALSETLNADLGAAGQLRVISGAAVAQMQQDLAPQPGLGLSRRQLDEIGRSLGCDLILTGTFVHADGRVRVEARLDDIASGGVLASFSVEEADGKLPELVSALSRELRSKLGLAPPLPGQTESVRASLSPNPSALRYYFLGVEALRIHDVARSIELFTQATREDADFAIAHSMLSISWRVLGHDAESQESARRAMALSSRLGREDRIAVEGAYYEVMSDWRQAVEKYQALWNFFPDNPAYGLKLVHQQLAGDRVDDAGRTLSQLRALPAPTDTDPRIDEVETYWLLRQQRYADVIKMTEQWAGHARARKSNHLLARALLNHARAAMQLHDLDRAAAALAESRQLFESLGNQAGIADVLRADSALLVLRGDLARAKERVDKAFEIATTINAQRVLPQVRIERAELLLKLNRSDLARADAHSALAMFRAANNATGAARAQAVLGGKAGEAAQSR